MANAARKVTEQIDEQPTTTEVAPSNLQALAGRINQEFAQIGWAEQLSADHRLNAGKLLAEAREAIGRGAPFDTWCKKNIERSRSDIYRCIALTETADPVEARTEEKTKAREGMKATRKKQQAVAMERVDPPVAPQSLTLETAVDVAKVEARINELLALEARASETGVLSWAASEHVENWNDPVLGIPAGQLVSMVRELSLALAPVYARTQEAVEARNPEVLREAADKLMEVLLAFFSDVKAEQNGDVNNTPRRGRPRKVAA